MIKGSLRNTFDQRLC